jgi:hypothetical protein
MTTTKNRVWAIVALVIMAAGFSACLKNDNITPQRDRAVVTIINGILTSENLDFYDNSTKVNQSGLPIGFYYTGYYIYGGIRTFSFKKSGQTTDYAAVTTLYDSLTYNTVIAYGDSTSPQMRSFEEDFTGYKEQSVNIRFFHLSPSTPAVDVYVDNQKVDSNRTFVGNSGFSTAFKPLTKSVFSNNIKIKLAGTDSLLVENTSPASPFNPNGAYTILLMGSKNFTDKKKLTVNNISSYY